MSEAARTKLTATKMPSALVRNAWLGTAIIASSDASTATALMRTARPAVSMVTSIASSGANPDRNAARKRTTMSSA